jgi:hypothetical protein
LLLRASGGFRSDRVIEPPKHEEEAQQSLKPRQQACHVCREQRRLRLLPPAAPSSLSPSSSPDPYRAALASAARSTAYSCSISARTLGFSRSASSSLRAHRSGTCGWDASLPCESDAQGPRPPLYLFPFGRPALSLRLPLGHALLLDLLLARPALLLGRRYRRRRRRRRLLVLQLLHLGRQVRHFYCTADGSTCEQSPRTRAAKGTRTSVQRRLDGPAASAPTSHPSTVRSCSPFAGSAGEKSLMLDPWRALKNRNEKCPRRPRGS